MKNDRQRSIGRRRFLQAAGTTSGALLMRSLATGIPASILLNPLSAQAQETTTGRILILVSSRQGDPINCHVPGTYIPGVERAGAASMTEAPLQLGQIATTAAQDWATHVPQNVLDRTLFFHHSTNTPVHGDMARVQRMMDATEKNDMMISLIAKETASLLGTVQSTPISLGASNGGELISSDGRLLANVAPLSVRQALAGETGLLKELTLLRDAQVDRIYGLYRDRGTRAQIRLLDSWVKSRDDVRNISDALTGRLQQIESNDELSQASTAAVLAAMKIAPVITLHIDFGGDNHGDSDLETEVERHGTGIQTLTHLMAELDALRTEGFLDHEVVVATLNVFGRTFKRNSVGGRDHNRDHHCMVVMGDGVNPGVIGGLTPKDDDFAAMGINSATGAGDEAGDIPLGDTLGAAGKTLGALLGVERERLDEMVTPGKVVQAALAG
jgi:hypothetical protein